MSEQNNQPRKAGSKTLEVLDALKGIIDPQLNSDIVSLGWAKNISIDGTKLRFSLVLPEDAQARAGFFHQMLEQALRNIEWITEVELLSNAEDSAADEVGGHHHAPAPPPLERPAPTPDTNLDNVKNVIAVGSGKGGVGKSTVAVNLALALARQGHSVGLLDADVYGPSVPLMLGLSGSPMVSAQQKLIPLEKHGIKVMSMGLLLRPDQAVVWRGPMVHGVVRQFLGDVDWGELDFLIVDLPPGTGDAPLSLTQAMPLTAAVVVTTPQQVAAAVAQKAMSMFERMGIRILGLVENMSYFVVPETGQRFHIFGEGGGRKLAEERAIPFLGEIPIDPRMCEGGDEGAPVVAAFPESELAAIFYKVAEGLAAQAVEHSKAAG
jgi:ATP-binding protein involved in chromosome partitioning